ncbi:carboxylate-amine ligase [Rubrobacter aplysinae]|uniref:carboxylate-amine ligase n=1 Tax=Rubrobacter aplysinae TaxID=909625 RepID=UPI00069FD0E8|nr:YbdK family carboxylate-amine ligase [Rubrobacter aplysinae]
MMAEGKSLIPEDAYETGAPEAMLGAEEELWLADPGSGKLAGGAQEILADAPEGDFSGELIDCEIESNSGVHPAPGGVAGDLVSRRRALAGYADGLGRLLGASGTHPIGDFREQEIIDQPHYQRLKEKLGWLIRRNNTFSLHVHYSVGGRERAIYLYNRLREYVPHLLALSANSPFWQNELVDQHSARAFVFSRGVPRAGLPEAFANWFRYTEHLDLLYQTGRIAKLGEIWWDVRPHPVLGTMEIRAFDAQTDAARNEALIILTAALCDRILAEYDSGEPRPILPVREIEENKWSAQQYGLYGEFLDPGRGEAVQTRRAVESLVEWLEAETERDLSGAQRLLEDVPESVRQLQVYRETGSTFAVVRDLATRTTSGLAGP